MPDPMDPFVDELTEAINRGDLDHCLKDIVKLCFERRKHMDPALWPMQVRTPVPQPEIKPATTPKRKVRRSVGEAVTKDDVAAATPTPQRPYKAIRKYPTAPNVALFDTLFKMYPMHFDDQSVKRPVLDPKWFSASALRRADGRPPDEHTFEYSGYIYDKRLFVGCILKHGNKLKVIKGIGNKMVALVPLTDTAQAPSFVGKHTLAQYLRPASSGR